MSERRVYSEKEVGEIIRRAVEFTEEGAAPYQPGVTQEELERIAAEVGVSPEALRRALREAEGKGAKRAPFALIQEVERVIEGELDPNDFDVVTDVMPMAGRSPHSQATQVGRSLTVQGWVGLAMSKLDLVSRGGRTRIKVHSNSIGAGMVTLYPAFVTAMISAGALSEARGPVFGVIGLAVAAGIAALFPWVARASHQRALKLADDAAARVEEAVQSAKGKQAPAALTEEERLEDRLGQG